MYNLTSYQKIAYNPLIQAAVISIVLKKNQIHEPARTYIDPNLSFHIFYIQRKQLIVGIPSQW